MPQYGISVKNGDGGISYLTTSILPLRKFKPKYAIYFENADVVLGYLTTSILPLREITPIMV